jgi:hypothetical protein
MATAAASGIGQNGLWTLFIDPPAYPRLFSINATEVVGFIKGHPLETNRCQKELLKLGSIRQEGPS